VRSRNRQENNLKISIVTSSKILHVYTYYIKDEKEKRKKKERNTKREGRRERERSVN